MERFLHSTRRMLAAAINCVAASLRARFIAAAVVAAIVGASSAEARHPTASRYLTPADRIYLISTRGIGTRCDCDGMVDGLRCEEFAYDATGRRHWQGVSWAEVFQQFAEPMPTVVFVHGNRIDAGVDKPHGLTAYQSLAANKASGAPIRYIIWSWPSSKVPGVVNDYQVKAARTGPVAWQLAWALDQMPVDTPMTLIGYSFGGRVVTGALHLLAGGQLGPLHLERRVHPVRPPVHAVLVAAAVHASWIRPGSYHGRALEQVDQLLLVNNHMDPAMRFYHLVFEGHVRPLGHSGISRASLGQFADRVQMVDTTGAVGRSHSLGDYFGSRTSVGRVLEQMVLSPMAADQDEALAVGVAEISAERN